MATKPSWLARLFSGGKGHSASAAARRWLWTQGQLLLNDFVVERVLGQGGMGKVYLVRSQLCGVRFAVKTILADRLGDEASWCNFLAELQTWIDLPEHPHLVSCRFFRTVRDEVAIFAEYMEGGSLAQWLKNGKLTRLEDILDVAIQCAWGLQAVHEAGLIPIPFTIRASHSPLIP